MEIENLMLPDEGSTQAYIQYVEMAVVIYYGK